MICSAASAYERLVGGIVADSKFAESKPEIVKRALASWFRALKYMNDKRNKEEVLEYFRVFFLLRNVEISRPSLESHIQSTVMFDFDDQLGLMKREGKSPPKSLLDKWTEGIGDFVVSKGMRPSRPEPAKFITDEYLKQIQDDPNLYGFVQGNSPSDFGVIVPELAVYKSQHSSDGILPTGLFLAAAIVMAFMALVSQGFGLSIPYLRSWSRRRYFNQSEQEYSPLEQSSPGYIELLDSHEMS